MLSDAQLIWIIAAGLTLLVMLPFLLRQRRLERATEEQEELAQTYGLKEPVTMHPVVDPSRCIGVGACVPACPEHEVLGIRDGQAYAVTPARCIGHGLCERACPMEAIQLVFGSEKRGIDLPRIQENFETNVPGLYIVGELGGMGLIRNAFEQGRQCVEGIVRANGRRGGGEVLDLLIVGCGPAGLAASLTAVHHGLHFKTIERENDIGGAVRNYPRKKLVMTAPIKVPGYGKLRHREIRKEALIEIWADIREKTGLEVTGGETVTGVKRKPDGLFNVETTRTTYRARRVILAIGRRGTPRKLGVPGEELPKVAYSLREPEAFQRDRLLVVGGGDSAVEAALALAEQPGNDVKLSYRRESFSRIKPGNLQRVEQALQQRKLEVLWSTSLLKVEPDSVVYRGPREDIVEIPNDYLFVFIGGVLPTPFLRACGVEIETKFGQP